MAFQGRPDLFASVSVAVIAANRSVPSPSGLASVIGDGVSIIDFLQPDDTEAGVLMS